MQTPSLLPYLLAFGMLQGHVSLAVDGMTAPLDDRAVLAMPPPANDLCSDVIPSTLNVGGTLTFIGDNTDATFAGDAVPGNVMSQYPSPNTWHAFTTTTCSNITVSYCATDSGWSNIWPLLTQYCPADSLIMASSNNTSACANGNHTFTFDQLAAGTYYLPVPNVGFGQGGGAYTIEVIAEDCAVTADSPDHCEDAVPEELSVGGSLTFIGDNTNATFAGDAVPGNVMSQFPSPNTWHAFTTTECANVTVSYCATDSGWSNIWPLLTQYCPADSLIMASSNNTTTCANGNHTFTFDQLAAGTYYLPVPNVGFGQGGGAYTVEVVAETCGSTSGPDHCEDAVPEELSAGSSLIFIGDNTNATFAGDAVPGNVMSQFPSPNTWHAFTTTECTNVTVSYCATDSGWSNIWPLLTQYCPADSLIFYSSQDQTTCANGNWTFSFDQLAAGTYYLPVPNVGFGQGGGAYTVEVIAEACVNITDHCEDAVPEELSAGSSLTFNGDNTNATFAGDAVPGNVMSQFPSPNTWHAFTTTECTNVTVSYCATDSGWSNIWPLLTQYCPADSLIFFSSQDQTTCVNGNWTFSFDSLEAGTYYLPVPNVGFGQGGGVYSIDVAATACTSIVPVNDLCSEISPEALAIGGTLSFTGDNTDATSAGDAVPGSLLDEFPFPNTWHAFTTTECTDVTVNYCGTDSGWSNVWKLLTTQCPADSVIQATSMDTTACANGNWTFSFDQLAAGTYYVPVPNVGFGQGGGVYNIEVGASVCFVGMGALNATDADWTVFPNPTTGDLTVRTSSRSGSATLELLDMTGRAVLGKTEMTSADGSVQWSLGGHIAPGTYLIRMTTLNGRSTQRLIVR
ncbi:MAG: T9SS type A sorting domain-containing protein [Flavobacteriales bacterium]|nr:T9SS type A sorting domain-containing protein [Flavobacteriales bacterium]